MWPPKNTQVIPQSTPGHIFHQVHPGTRIKILYAGEQGEPLMPNSEGPAMCWACPVPGDAAIQTDGQAARM